MDGICEDYVRRSPTGFCWEEATGCNETHPTEFYGIVQAFVVRFDVMRRAHQFPVQLDTTGERRESLS